MDRVFPRGCHCPRGRGSAFSSTEPHYSYDATGILILDRVTPVITALFTEFKLDESQPGDGAAYIARISESNDPQWTDVLDGLVELVKQLGINAPEKDLSIKTLLEILATHFGADQNEQLAQLIAHHRFEDAAELDVLFLIATRFNDGHNLVAIQFEGCWSSQKTRLFEFGGNGCFISREVRLFSTSTHVLQLGEKLRNAILANAIDEATTLIAQETLNVLAGIKDGGLRKQLQRAVANYLLLTLSSNT